MLRLFIALYLYSKNGILNDFSITKKIPSFNSIKYFKNIISLDNLNDIKENPKLISKYWLEAQKNYIKKNKDPFIIWKSHNAQIKYKGYVFSNYIYSLCFFYIVRDPRSVLISMKHHFGFKSYTESLNYITNDNFITNYMEKENQVPEFILSWKSNYLSWKNFLNFNVNSGLIIKYEDMVKLPEETFEKIIKFLDKKLNKNFDKKKFNNCIKSINFHNLQKIENKFNFDEKSNKTKKFFRKGIVDEWNTSLNSEILEKLEKIFYNEMKYLGYL